MLFESKPIFQAEIAHLPVFSQKKKKKKEDINPIYAHQVIGEIQKQKFHSY